VQETDLIKRIKENDQKAFTELIDKYKQQAFRLAMGFMHDKALADDIVQDTFIKFWEIKDDYEIKAKFSTWMYRVVSNKAINVLRRNKFSSVFSTFSANNSENDLNYEDTLAEEQEKNAEEKFRQEHIKIALKNAIDSLPKRQKIAFVLSKYEDFSYKEISEIMELSVSSIESLLHRAKTNLQGKLLTTYKSIN